MNIVKPLVTGLFCVCTLLADNTLHVGTPVLDRPTLTALGVQLPITGDDNFNGSVSLRYRETGTQNWKTGLPLFRVHPESTSTWVVAPQFAGSIFDLRPGRSYDIELHAIDPDGPVDQILNLSGSTRPVPSDPALPHVHNVSDNTSLANALQAAAPGDVIILADGIYSGGPIYFFGSGTAANPIVIRGTSQSGTIIDGNGCSNCNILEIYGSYVHLENMTLRNAQRAIRFQTPGTQGNVIRRVTITNVILGIGMRENSLDYYIADNVLQGRLTWPMVYSDDSGVHANDDGINVMGFGHVVAHNLISGFGDAMKTEQEGARAVDFYGNDILWTYDNALELDESEGNSRCFRNRFTNTYAPISVQPILGGPSYIFRNIVVNVKDEQMKFHSLNGIQTNGVLSYHNTFVSPATDLLMNTPDATHHFRIENNLFVGPAAPAQAVNWGGPIDDGTFDYNGYRGDGWFIFNFLNIGYQNYPSFAAAQSAGLVEPHGFLLNTPVFANGLVPPSSYTVQMSPQDVTLSSGSNAIDRGLVLPNINDGYTGSAPDLGAVEIGCPTPIYGPRPAGTDETNEPFGCLSAVTSTPPISISVSPASVNLLPKAQQQFTATVTNTSNPGVTWSMVPSLGVLSQAGFYTAPDSVASATAITITAASVADPTKTAVATVNLTPAPALSVTISPALVSLGQNGQQQFTASISNSTNTGVSWSMTPSLGTLSSTGLYTAPASITSASNVTITATSAADPSKSASATVTLTAAVGLSISPLSVSLGQNGQQQFTAAVSNSTNTAVNWSMSPALGTLTTSGLYTAPASIASATAVTITATSAADPTKIATATVNLTPAVVLSLTPASVSLGANGQQQFTAAVTNSTNTAVNWSMSPALGTLTTSGLYTAPALIASATAVTITATSAADPTKIATATVNLTPAVLLSLTPASVSLGPNGQQVFTALVTNSTNTAVNWSMSPWLGNLTNSGVYTAPASITSPSVVTITVTSAADPTKNASATVNLVPALAVSVTLTPASVNLNQNGTQQFVATVFNSSNSTVIWSMSPSLGSLSASGFYTAPGSITSAGVVTITATSAADSSKFATAIVNLTPSLAVSIGIAPASVTLGQNGQQQFTATVANASSSAVIWSMSPALGTLSASGLYTAPAQISNASKITITATSVADGSKKATAQVSLSPSNRPKLVTVWPYTANLKQNGTVQFTASVMNSDDQSVTWSTWSPVGNLSSNGLYMAPSTVTVPMWISITATSIADPTKSATAWVLVSNQ